MGDLSRRDFLKTGAIAAAATTLAPAGRALAADKGPIKWGVLDTMSGPFGVFGKGNLGGVKLAVKEINDKGGIMGRRIEIVVEDDEANTEVSARKAKKMILQDKVDVLHGAASTACSGVMMKIAAQYKVLQFDTEYDSRTTLPERSRYYFMPTCINEELERARMIGIKQMYKPEEIKRWFVWFPDYSYGRDMRDVYQSDLKKFVPDAEIVGMMGHPLGEMDFSTYFVKILEAKPQVFLSVDWAGDATNFISQAIPYGFFDKIPIFSLNGACMSTIVALKDKLPKMIYISEQCNPYLPHMEKWRNDYYAYAGEWPTEDCAPMYYEAVYMYKAAAEKAKSFKTEDIINALEGMDFVGPSGHRKIRKDHGADFEYLVLSDLVSSDKYPFKVPGKMLKIPYKDCKYTDAELAKMGCKFCEGKGDK